MRRGRILVGTSGWIYDHWKGRFYPRGLPAGRQLAYLAERFATVEINGTFYSLSRPHCFERWRAATPPGFVFAVKGSRYITHMLKLKNAREPLANFFAQGILRLGAALGPILWQLPPMLSFDEARVRAFLALLPRDLDEAARLARKHDARLTGRSSLRAPDGEQRLRHAFEIRHASWLDERALQLFAESDVALVTADTADRHPLSLERTTDDFAYVRLHGARKLYASRYSDGELDDWAALVDGWAARGSDVYVYFDNDDKAYAPGDARRLMNRIGRTYELTRAAPAP